ncbi:MAG TPA: MqnA/MqnD/SBP family protein, partial [Gemmatimonadales bacterium]|nr:MqnA/MqnD/SBP family protein [Gemmatimonadales bacterium]
MRLGRIPWINCYPVYGAIDRGLISVPAEIVSGTASELNDLMATGALQVSVVSAVEYARNAALYDLL